MADLERETFKSSLDMAGNVLRALGLTYSAAKQAMETFEAHDDTYLKANYQYHGDMEALTTRAKRAASELEALFNQDAAHE